jgi:hypothetical protein
MKQRALIASAILLMLSVILGFRVWLSVSHAQKAEGIVESVATISEPNKGFPVSILFTTKEGQDIHFMTYTRFRLGSPILMPGKHVGIIYDALSPQNTAQIDSFFRVWIWPVICLVAGLSFLIFIFS